MSMSVAEAAGSRLNATGNASVKGAGKLLGVWVSSATTATLKFADGGGTIANTFTPTAPAYYKLPFAFSGDLTITATGTIDYTVAYEV